MKKLKDLIKSLTANGDFAGLAKLASVIEYVLEETLMEMYFFITPLANDPTGDVFLAELHKLGFDLIVPEDHLLLHANPDTLAEQYPDVDYDEVSVAWWTAMMITLSASSPCFESGVLDTLCSFVTNLSDSTPGETAKEILNEWNAN